MNKHARQADVTDPVIVAHQHLFGYVAHLHDARTLIATFREAALSNAASDTFAARWPSLMDSLIRVLPNEEQFEDSLHEACRLSGKKSAEHELLRGFASRIENVKAVAKAFGEAALAAASSNAATRIDWPSLMSALVDLLPSDEALEEGIYQAMDSLKAPAAPPSKDDGSEPVVKTHVSTVGTSPTHRRSQLVEREKAESRGA